MSVLDDVLADLAAEGECLDALVSELDEQAWRTPTPAEGWDIATTVAHLLWTDETSVKAIAGTLCTHGPADKEPWDEVVLKAFEDPTGFVDTEALGLAGSLEGAELLARWRGSRADLDAALRAVPDGQRLMWFGPPMSPASMATARLMETWAHGIDVADALVAAGVLDARPAPTDRIRHVVSIGVRTRGYAFANNGLEPPTAEIRVELTAPSGDVWTYGPDDAHQRVTGSAYDFCQLVTQRVHRSDTDLVAQGEDAQQWLDIAQAFAGPAGGGRDPKGENA